MAVSISHDPNYTFSHVRFFYTGHESFTLLDELDEEPEFGVLADEPLTPQMSLTLRSHTTPIDEFPLGQVIRTRPSPTPANFVFAAVAHRVRV